MYLSTQKVKKLKRQKREKSTRRVAFSYVERELHFYRERRYLNLPGSMSGKVGNFLKRILVEFAKIVSTDFPGGVILLRLSFLHRMPSSVSSTFSVRSSSCRRMVLAKLNGEITIVIKTLVQQSSANSDRRIRKPALL